MRIWPLLQGESGTERQVQCLRFPRCETGCELPANTLLTFLDAVGQCCSRGSSQKPGTLLSHSRCRRQTPRVKSGYVSEGSLQGSVSAPFAGIWSGWLIKYPSVFFPVLRTDLGFPTSLDTAPSPEVPHLTLGHLQQGHKPAGHLLGYGTTITASRDRVHSGRLQCGPEAVTGLWLYDPNAGERQRGRGLLRKGSKRGRFCPSDGRLLGCPIQVTTGWLCGPPCPAPPQKE